MPAPDDPETAASEGRGARALTYAFRAAGVILITLVVFPVYGLLDGPDAGRLPRGSVAAAEVSRSMLVFGSLLVLAVATVASRIVDPAAIDRFFSRLSGSLLRLPPRWFALGLSLVATALTLSFSLAVLEGKPNLGDAMVQLLHARFVAAGALAGPADEFLEFWQLQNSLATPTGWVSQYPPGFVMLLAGGLKLGVVQLAGPLLAGATVLFTALAAERLLPRDRAVARVGAVMLCLSPFMIGLAGAFMNHIGAAAFTSGAIYCGVRARDDDSLGWAALAGIATGCVFSIRPLSAIVAAAVVTVVWLTDDTNPRRPASFVRRSLAAFVGIAPLLAAVGWYNAHFFGSPLTFGYAASQGPLVGPGFHRDPTGAFYGPVQALGFTSADLVTFSLYLLETPIPVVLIAGLYLLLAKRFSVGVRVIALWALLPVLANALYWHHGIFMGPRMLNESTPPWALLTAVAAVGLVRLVPRETMWRNYSPRAALAVALAVSWAAGILYLAPQRLVSYGGPWMESTRITVAGGAGPSLVFVHGAWTGRVAMRLVAHGMRLDSLEAAMRQNTTCDTHAYAKWYATPPAERGVQPPLDFSFIPRDPPPQVRIAAGYDIRARPGVPLSAECLREVASDTLGIVDVGPLLWQGDLPGLDGRGTMFVRDMGPEANARLIARYPDREPLVLMRHGDQQPKLVPYDEGMKTLWGSGAGSRR